MLLRKSHPDSSAYFLASGRLGVHPVLRFLTAWLTLAAAAAMALTPKIDITHPLPGVTLTEEVRQNPPLRLHWVQVNISDPAVHLRISRGGISPAAPWETTLLPVSKIARRENFDVAVNGSYFMPDETRVIFGFKDPYFEGNPARACGWTVCDRFLLSQNPLSTDFSTLVVHGNGRVSISKLTGPPLGARQAVSGIALLLDGHDVTGDGDHNLLPRTAVGIDAAGKILTLLVVDGHRPSFSVGLTSDQTSHEMSKLGCCAAISLDGGGSSTLVIRNNEKWPVINTPSDGHTLLFGPSFERPVADALGISIDPPPSK
jgi:hypothetical protein